MMYKAFSKQINFLDYKCTSTFFQYFKRRKTKRGEQDGHLKAIQAAISIRNDEKRKKKKKLTYKIVHNIEKIVITNVIDVNIKQTNTTYIYIYTLTLMITV